MTDQPLDLNALLQQAQTMGASLLAAQAQAAEAEMVGRAGGGAVTVTMRGDYEVVAVTIDPAVVDATEIDLLEDLVQAAVNDAIGQVQQNQPDPLAGFDLGGLLGGGLSGGPADS
jgi:hypothetical protein